MSADILAVAEQFAAGWPVNAVAPLGNGLINDTFLVTTRHNSFVLQRVNSKVFPEPRHVIDNLSQLSRHIEQKPAAAVHLQIPKLLPSRDGTAFYEDAEQHLWRALQLIQPAESRERISRNEEAAQVGFALAHFHRLCADLPADVLHDTLPGFHVTPLYFQQYQALLAETKLPADADFLSCRDFIQAHQHNIELLASARQRGLLQDRVIHGDPKLNNFLFRPGTHQVVSLIDLDTVKPGLLHYDIGDCIRSCCHDRQNDRFDLARCQIILQHYILEAGDSLRSSDYDYLYAAIWLIPFELGMRFFSDFLAGNRYFKAASPRHNLQRAVSQFALCRDIERQQAALRGFIELLKKA